MEEIVKVGKRVREKQQVRYFKVPFLHQEKKLNVHIHKT